MARSPLQFHPRSNPSLRSPAPLPPKGLGGWLAAHTENSKQQPGRQLFVQLAALPPHPIRASASLKASPRHLTEQMAAPYMLLLRPATAPSPTSLLLPPADAHSSWRAAVVTHRTPARSSAAGDGDQVRDIAVFFLTC